MRITIERVGGRVYFGGDTYPAKGQIKGIGGHWDGDRRQWWVGAVKLAAAQQLVAELVAKAATKATAEPIASHRVTVAASQHPKRAAAKTAVSMCGRRDCRRLRGGWCHDCHDAM